MNKLAIWPPMLASSCRTAYLASDGEDGVGKGDRVPHHPVPGLRVSALRPRVVGQREQLIQHLRRRAFYQLGAIRASSTAKLQPRNKFCSKRNCSNLLVFYQFRGVRISPVKMFESLTLSSYLTLAD